MALSADTIWEIRANGNTDNGGGFVDGASGTDYSQQDAAQVSYTDLAIDAADNTILTSATTPFTAAHVGNILNITGGSGFTQGRYQIVSVDGSNKATVDRACGSTGSTSGTGKLGGARILVDAAFNDMVNGNIAYIKADGTHTLTGDCNGGDASQTAPIKLYGYNSSRGDNPMGTNRPLIASGNYHITLENYWFLYNCRFTGTDTNILVFQVQSIARNCYMYNSSGTSNRNCAYFYADGGAAFDCELICTNGRAAETTGNGIRTRLFYCYCHDSDVGFRITGGSCIVGFCIFDTCVTSGLDTTTDDGTTVFNCTFYNCGIGITATDVTRYIVFNNIIDSCTTGISETVQNDGNWIDFNNFSNNSTDRTNTGTGDNDTAYSPNFTDAGGGDFSLQTGSSCIGSALQLRIGI